MKNIFKKKLQSFFCALCLLVLPSLGLAQPFVLQAVGIPGVNTAALDWGDYDADGDLDLLVVGQLYTNLRITRIYRNDGGSFTDSNAGLPGIAFGDGAWGDYDNDGDLDVVLIGTMANNNDIARIYRNDAGLFTDINTGLPGFREGTCNWGDFDNDGDQDIILSGNSTTASGPDVTIFRNESGAFVDSQEGFNGMHTSAVAIGDYDSDGDLDLFLSGTHVQNQLQYFESQLFRNQAGIFTQEVTSQFQALYSPAAAWADYDNDGDLDLALAGYASTGNTAAKIYRNDAGSFVDINASLQGFSGGSTSWGDFDNDGDADLLITGNSGNPGYALYRNDGTSFSEVINAGFHGLAHSDAIWGDYDNDNDLDVIYAGTNFQTYATDLFRNDILTDNTAPSIPTGLLAAFQAPNSIRFTWNAANDAETPIAGLSYHLSIGNSPNSYDVSSPFADTATGLRMIAALGNLQGTSWTLRNVHLGTYYAAISAIDPGLKGSAFSSQASVTVTTISTADGVDAKQNIMAGPNPTRGQISIHPQFALKSKGQYTLTNLAGQTLPGFSGVWDGELSLDLSELPAATFLLRLEAKGLESGSVIRIVKQ